MENIGAVQLGRETDKKFLTALIPDGWKEKIYEHDTFWACECRRDDGRTAGNCIEQDKQFDKVCNNIEKEFGEYLMEIYSITSSGVHFVVYLKKE